MAYLSEIEETHLSGLQHIDALLLDMPDWNYLTEDGTQFRTTLYFTFSVSSGLEGGRTDITAFTAHQEAAVREILDYISELTGIDFEETSNGNAADIHFASAYLDGGISGLSSAQSGYSYLGEELKAYTADSWVYLNHSIAEYSTEPTSGSATWETLLHEMGHTLGLKHPFEAGGDNTTILQDPFTDDTAHTLMSYTHVDNTHYATYNEYDVAAMEFLYGGDGLGDEWGVGTAGTALLGSTLNETFELAQGNVRLSDLGGADAVVYAQSLNTYNFSMADDWLNITGTDINHYIDASIEEIRFADQNISYTALANIASGGSNSAPDAVDDHISTEEDTPVTFSVLENDTDEDGDILSIVSFSVPAHGILVENSDGTFTYTPENNYNGQDSVSYTISDGSGQEDSAMVALEVTAVNDPPAGDVVITGNATQGQTLSLESHDIADVDGVGAFYYQWLRNGTDIQGADSTNYTLTQNDVGAQISVALSYTDGNGTLETLISAATAPVANINDAPILQSPAPITYTDTSEQDIFLETNGTLVATDADEDSLTYGIADGIDQGEGFVSLGGTYGSLMLNTTTGAYTFFHNDSAIQSLSSNATETFTLTVTDSYAITQAQLDIDIVAVNDMPQANSDSATTDQDTAVVISALANDTDAENDTLSITSTTDPSHGSVSISEDNQILYTPEADYTGTDSFDYTISDGNGGTDTATVNVTIEEVEDDNTYFCYSEEFYLLNNPDVAAAVSSGAFANGWQHYSNYGYLEGRSFAKPDNYSDFSEKFYLLNNPDVAAAVEAGAFINGWEHYADFGQAEGRSYAAPEGYGDFSEEFYLLNNSDVAAAVDAGYLSSAWYHYSNFGEAEGRSYAMPEGYDDFNEEFYFLNNPDVAAAVDAGYLPSAWVHYINFGQSEGRSYAMPEEYGDFSEEVYLLNNPDVAAALAAGAFINGWEHYADFGQDEGRSYAVPEILLQSVSCSQESQAIEQAMIYMTTDYMADDDAVELLGLADDVMDDLLGA